MERNTSWPNGYRVGDSVIHMAELRKAHVVAVPKEVVPAGQVPVMYDNEEGCYVNVPHSELQRPF